MNAVRKVVFWFAGATCLVPGASAFAQVIINEFIIDERTASSGIVHPSTREFLELYNPGPGAVDIGNWQLKTIQIGNNFNTPNGTHTYTIPEGTSIGADDYFVIGHTGGPGVDYAPTPLFNGDLFPDGNTHTPAVPPMPAIGSNGQFVFELRDASAMLADAVAVETFRGSERDNITAEQAAFTGGGIWPQIIATNVPVGAPQFNTRASVARYMDGVRTGANGRDFGFLPETPGASNNLPEVPAHVVPDVDSLAIETPLGNAYGYYGSFVLPRVVDPATIDAGEVNPKAVSPPPVGTNAIINYDNTGGGNVIASKQLVNSFDVYAYIDTDDYNLLAGHPDDALFGEQTIYGIGTTDPFFARSNSAGLVTDASTANGSTGVGWQIQKVERNFGTAVETRTVLQLVNFGDGGDSLPEDNEWLVIEEFDLSGEASGWQRLGVEYDPETGVVTARYNDEIFEFEYSGLAGDFNQDGAVDAADYVVWRKSGGAPEA
jgi:hypothetical protein